MELLSRAEASAHSFSHYFTGRACKRGHTAPRRVDNKDCEACRSERLRTWRTRNPRRRLEHNRTWKKANVRHVRGINATRRASKLQATPPWVDHSELKRIYAECPAGHHVDHIVPLKHPQVCGLHVPWNLQYLSALENLRKGNRLLNAA